MRERIAWLLLLLLTAACGARSNLTSSVSSGSDASSSSGAGGASCSATPPLPITDATSVAVQVFADSIAVDGSSVLVASSSRFPGGAGSDPDPTWRVRLVSGDLSSMGPSQIVLTHAPGALMSSGYVAAGFGHRGFVAWDFVAGSRFVPLAADGSPTGPPVSLGTDVLSWLTATPDGFVALQSGEMWQAPQALLTLDPSGAVLATAVLSSPVPFTDMAAPGPGLMAFDDGSLLVTWEGNSPFSITAQHLSAAGTPMAPPAQLFDLSKQTAGNDVFAMASLGSSALVAWGNDLMGYKAIASADEDGHVGPQTIFGSGISESLGVGAGAAGAFASWAEVTDGSAIGSLVAQRMAPEGVPIGASFPIAPGLEATAPALAATPAGEVVAFTGSAPSQPQQVYVTLLSCPP